MALKDLQNQVNSIDDRLNKHLEQGIDVWKALEEVKTDLAWLKKAFWVLTTLGMTFNGLLVKFILSKVVFHE